MVVSAVKGVCERELKRELKRESKRVKFSSTSEKTKNEEPMYERIRS